MWKGEIGALEDDLFAGSATSATTVCGLAGCMVVRAPMASMNRTMICPVSSLYSNTYARLGIHLFRRSEIVESPSHGQELVRQFPGPYRSEDRSAA